MVANRGKIYYYRKPVIYTLYLGTQAMHHPAATTFLPPNNGQFPASPGPPWNNAQLEQLEPAFNLSLFALLAFAT